ncbi:MAG: Tetratricopeptide TPR_1 repeat-containing protein [candidate division TM6 bacterium GW2011_GWF2_37_49]|nr:MAG: Tetratricopeptide TPR_1 repeat-containing protein [candidate division TM6 bacterium GW2011_GWF2_37_49]
MFKISKKFIFTLIFCGIFVGGLACVSKAECVKLSSLEDGDSDENKSTMYYNVLKAGYYSHAGNACKAIKSFNSAFEMQPPIYIYEPYLKLLFEMGNLKKVIDIYSKNTKKFEAKFKNNLDFWVVIAQALLVSNKDTEAGKIFGDLIKNFPDNEQVAYYHTMSMLKSNQLDKALTFLNDCLNKPIFKQKFFLFYFLRSKIYLQKSRHELALKDIEKSLKLFPSFDRGWLIQSMLMEHQGKVAEAINGYMQFLNIVGRDEMVEKQVIQLLFNQKRYDDAAKYLKKLKGDTPEYYFNLALIEFNSGRLPQALKVVNTCLARSPLISPARLLKIDILLSMNNFKGCLKFMEEWLSQKTLDTAAINTLMLLRKTPIQIQNVTKLLENVVAKNKYHIGLLAALADLYIEQKLFKKGVDYYKQIHDLTPNQELKSKVMFQMAYVHFSNDQLNQAKDVLNKAINDKNSLVDPQSYNLIAYIQAKQKKDLNKAEEMINKALESDKYSPVFLDTKGFVYLQKGLHHKALELFERASTISPGNLDIINHVEQAKSLIVSQAQIVAK